MAEWRRKAYYRTRVLIPVDECLDSAFGDCLVCLTGGELNLIRNLLLYAERRSTFVDEYHETYYLAPTNNDWDALQEMKAHLEGNLMNCEQFTSDLQEILDWVRLQGTLPGGSFSEAEEAAFPYDDVIADDELTPAEEDACAIAQLWFEWGYQVITEYVLPATRWGFDYLVPAVAGFIALAIGGPPAAMGVYALAEFIQELLEIFYRGAETNLVNWMDTNKQDIVCVLWAGLVSGGDASSLWGLVLSEIITPAEDISAGDKLMLDLFMGSWAGSNALLAFVAETEWATSNVEAGYCDGCEMPDTGLYWQPDSDAWYNTGEGWTFYDRSHDPVTTLPALVFQEVGWQPHSLDNVTIHLKNEFGVNEGELVWRNQVHDEATFWIKFRGYNLSEESHPQFQRSVQSGPFDWDDMNKQHHVRVGTRFSYTGDPTAYITIELLTGP